MNYKIPQELLETTLKYLATRPIQEVDGLFHQLQGLKKIENEKAPNKEVRPPVVKEDKGNSKP